MHLALCLRLTSGKQRGAVVLVRSNGEELRDPAQWAEAGLVCTVIDRVYPLAEVAAAHKHLRTFRTRGKLIRRVRNGE